MTGEMNPFARRFADVLFSRFPEWQAFARVDPQDAPIPGSLFVEVPSPRPDGKTLGIETDEDEVTIFFDLWHFHYGAWTGAPEAESFAEAIGFLADLVREEVSVLVTTRDGEWAGSHLVYRGEDLPRLDPGEQARLVSWSGRLDRVYDRGGLENQPNVQSEIPRPRHSVEPVHESGRSDGSTSPDGSQR